METCSSCPVCGDSNLKKLRKCTACKLIAYCSPAHQKEHWKVHKRNCNPFKFTSDPVFGLQWMATRDIEVGSLILVEKPVFSIPIWPGFNWCCLCCGHNFNKKFPRPCSSCQWPICSTECEKEKIHKENECVVFKLQKIKFPPRPELSHWVSKNYHSSLDSPSSTVLATCVAFIRGILLQKKLKSKSYNNFVYALQNIHDPKQREGKDESGKEINFAVLKKFINLDQLEVPQVDWEMLKKVFYKMKIEKKPGWTIIPEDKKSKTKVVLTKGPLKQFPVFTVYPKWSLLNHSCSSNCLSREFTDNKFRRTVCTTAEVKKGQLLTINYGDIELESMARKDRQQIILKGWAFQCQCERCLDPTELNSFMDAIACVKCRPPPSVYPNHPPIKKKKEPPEKINLGYLLPLCPLNFDADSPWKCNQCDAMERYDHVFKLTTELMINFAKMVEPLHKETPRGFHQVKFQKILQVFEKFENKCQPLLHPNHNILMFVAEKIVQRFEDNPIAVATLCGHEFNVLMAKGLYLLSIANKYAPQLSDTRGRLLSFLMEWGLAGMRKVHGLTSREKSELCVAVNSYQNERISLFHRDPLSNRPPMEDPMRRVVESLELMRPIEDVEPFKYQLPPM